MTELGFTPATDLAGALRRREIASRELLNHYLGRIERDNPALNAVVTLDEERARRQAWAADEAAARGELWGPLHGLPMTVKDSIETAGLRTTAGATELADHVPERDADAVARLRSAGAVIFGKTNLPTYAMDVQSYNPVFGTTNNPWDTARTPGGSSGGAAAALAAGLTGFELGSDIGGSIRNPAHFCGVFGLKPSYGIVPARGHIPGPPSTLTTADISVIGPMGRSADDLDLGLDVLAGPDPIASVAWRLDLPPPRADSLARYRLAAWLDDPYCPTDSDVLEVLAAAVDALRGNGAAVDERARPVELPAADRLFRQLLQGAVCNGYPRRVFDRLRDEAAAASPDDDSPRLRTARDITQRKRDWNSAHERRLQLASRWATFFRDHDVLLCPVTPTAAIPHDHAPDLDARTISVNGQHRPYWDQLTWAGLTGMAYLPAAVVPVGRTRQGLPVGLQVVAAHLEDRTAVDVARRIATVVGGFLPAVGAQQVSTSETSSGPSGPRSGT
ncbi:MAG: amidase [Pseudonocardiaceae bacterium]|nr:amidase [Pseudonocardiaceae bacterium]